jgi:hypothetical protein
VPIAHIKVSSRHSPISLLNVKPLFCNSHLFEILKTLKPKQRLCRPPSLPCRALRLILGQQDPQLKALDRMGAGFGGLLPHRRQQVCVCMFVGATLHASYAKICVCTVLKHVPKIITCLRYFQQQIEMRTHTQHTHTHAHALAYTLQPFLTPAADPHSPVSRASRIQLPAATFLASAPTLPTNLRVDCGDSAAKDHLRSSEHYRQSLSHRPATTGGEEATLGASVFFI